MNRRNVLFVGTLLIGMTAALGASAALVKSGTPAVKFFAKGKGLGMVPMDVNGSSSNLGVTEKDGKISVTVPVSSFSTGIEMRDKHMKSKYLHADKHPNVTLVVERSALQFPNGKPVKSDATGQLTLHGQTKAKKFSYKAEQSGGVLKVSAAFDIDITQFGIEKPEEYGVKIEPNVKIDVKFEVKDN